jgi:hypothetical protein
VQELLRPHASHGAEAAQGPLPRADTRVEADAFEYDVHG